MVQGQHWSDDTTGEVMKQHRWTTSEAVNTVKCSWWWAKTSPETCSADWVQINKPESWILWVINYELIFSVCLKALSTAMAIWCQWQMNKILVGRIGRIILTGENRCTGRETRSLLFRPPKIPRELTRDRSQASAVRRYDSLLLVIL